MEGGEREYCMVCVKENALRTRGFLLINPNPGLSTPRTRSCSFNGTRDLDFCNERTSTWKTRRRYVFAR